MYKKIKYLHTSWWDIFFNPKVWIFFIFLHKNVCFHGEIRKLSTWYPLLSRPMTYMEISIYWLQLSWCNFSYMLHLIDLLHYYFTGVQEKTWMYLKKIKHKMNFHILLITDYMVNVVKFWTLYSTFFCLIKCCFLYSSFLKYLMHMPFCQQLWYTNL